MPGSISIRGARNHNLKNVSVEIPRERLVVVTGLSGSGKSTLAFDTLYAEGQRRYVESLSAYARQFLEQMEKPDCDGIDGLSPAIAIGQRGGARNPRSTVGTVTEIADHLRLLYARIGVPLCWQCERPITAQTVQQVVDGLSGHPEGSRLQVYAPVVRDQKGEHRQCLDELRRSGFVRVRVDGDLRELAEPWSLDRSRRHTIEVLVDRIVLREGVAGRLSDSIEAAFAQANGLVLVEVQATRDAPIEAFFFSRRHACAVCGVSYPEITPRFFSFNSPQGACPTCNGLGVERRIDPELVVRAPHEPLGKALAPVVGRALPKLSERLRRFASTHGVDLSAAVASWPAAAKKALLYGDPADADDDATIFEGLIPWLDRRQRGTQSRWLRSELDSVVAETRCGACGGGRLRREACFVRVGGKSIVELGALPVGAADRFLRGLELDPQATEIARPIIRDATARLGFLVDVGLDYLTLNRGAASLSGGEEQRIRLATQIGAALSGVLYVLDEPSIGLHPRDTARLLATLMRLRDLGNTVVVVEHDRDIIEAADHVIDMGPGAGTEGGRVIALGTPAEVRASPESLTGRYLSGELTIPVPAQRRGGSGWNLGVRGASARNLRDIDVDVPLGTLTCVTGVSGSGKSTLVVDTLYRALARRLGLGRAEAGRHRELVGWQLVDKVVEIGQSPIGRTPRSNPATYTGLFGPIRELFAQLPEARTRGYGPGRFSFNVAGGRCEACQGGGVIAIEMHFLPDVLVTCEVCAGRRYDRETLAVRFKGLNVADVLDLTITEALDVLGSIPAIRQRLDVLREVGLGYLRLGQSGSTLSGGEAQRVRLARELARRATGRTLYVLDEPTTGLHFDDVRRLLDVLGRLVDAGNTVLLIEHNLDLIRAADHVIDLGPEGGEAGGRVLACGPPTEIARVPGSHTGAALARLGVE
jgi:excinuclease ABC subunit A